MTRKKDDFDKILHKELKNKIGAAYFLNAALKDCDIKHFLACIKDVIVANEGFAQIAKKANVSRESLYRSLSGKRNPPIAHIDKIFNNRIKPK